MTVSIHLPEEAEKRLRARAAAAGQDVESFVNQVLAEELAAEEISPVAAQVEDFGQRLRQLIAGHGIRRDRLTTVASRSTPSAVNEGLARHEHPAADG